MIQIPQMGIKIIRRAKWYKFPKWEYRSYDKASDKIPSSKECKSHDKANDKIP